MMRIKSGRAASAMWNDDRNLPGERNYIKWRLLLHVTKLSHFRVPLQARCATKESDAE